MITDEHAIFSIYVCMYVASQKTVFRNMCTIQRNNFMLCICIATIASDLLSRI